jgi:hypothetical protein
MTIRRLLKSWATPPVSWPDGFELLRVAQRLLRPRALGHLRAQRVVRRLQLARPLGDQALQLLRRPVALGQVLAHLVLPPPRAHRGLHGARQGDGLDRPLEDRHVPERRHQPPAPRRDRRVHALAGQHHEGHVRPRRLPLDPGDQLFDRLVVQRLLGDEHGVGPGREAGDELREVGAGARRQVRAAEQLGRRRAVPPDRGEDEHPRAAAVSGRRAHRRPGAGSWCRCSGACP